MKVAVSLVGWAPFEARLHTDGREISPFAREGRRGPADAEVGIGLGRWKSAAASETVFDLTGSVQPGENVVMIELMGTGNLISFDVYEGRSW